jgi:hypothetical protein
MGYKLENLCTQALPYWEMPLAKNPNRVTEEDVASAVLRVLNAYPCRAACIQDLKVQIPKYLRLSESDRARSKTRPSEEIWEQQIRSITSHCERPGNFIYEGYLERIRGGLRITAAGRKYINSVCPASSLSPANHAMPRHENVEATTSQQGRQAGP